MKNQLSVLQLCLIIFVFGTIQKVNAQIIWQDNFDSYVTDSIIDPQSTDWVGWGQLVTSGMVSSDTSSSGASSLKIWNGTPSGTAAGGNLSDVVRKFGDSTSGRYMLSFKVFVPSAGNAGTYWNIQHIINATYTGQQWAMEIYLNPSGTASTITAGGVATNIPTKYDQWVEVRHIFDLDADSASFYYDGILIESHQFSLQSNTTVPGLNQLAGIDLFAACQGTGCTTLGYFDDFEFRDFPYPPNDAGVSKIDIPSYCLNDSTSIDISVSNSGSNTIDTLTLNWSIDGVLQPSFLYTNSLGTKGTAVINLGNYLFNGTPPYSIKAWTSQPNNVNDTINFNDTLTTAVGGPSLNGSYTLNPSLPSSSTNYTSLDSLSFALSVSGICGPVVVNVAPGVYNGTLSLNQVDGTSAINTITIDGGDSSLVTIQDSLITQNAIVRLNSASYVTIKNMTLKSYYIGTTDHWGVHFSGNARYDSIVNCRILLDPTNTSGGNVVGASGNLVNDFADGNNASWVTVMNCYLSGGYYGVHFEGGGTGSYNNVGNSFINNTLRANYYYGMYTDDQDSMQIVGNDISQLRNSTFNYGIYGSDAMNFKVNKNKILAYYYSLYMINANSVLFADAPAEIVNNMIISTNGYGIYLNTGILINVWHNSVRAEASLDAFYTTGSFTDSLDVRNNIFTSVSGNAVDVSERDSVIFLKFDNNVFNTGGTILLRFDGVNYTDLAAYQLAQTNFGANSLEGDPEFLSNRDLHIIGPFVNNTGDNFVGVTSDIDGDSRPYPFSTTVDPGADEFDPPSCPPPSALRTYNPSIDSVTIVVDGANPNYQYNIVLAGQAQGSGILGSFLSDSARVGGISPSTNYELYVREVCARGDSSVWFGPISFSSAYAIPYSETFESFTTGITQDPWPKGWSSTTTTDPNWESDNAGTPSNPTGPIVDHTLGTSTGIYIYMETSGGNSNDSADFISPTVYVDSANTNFELSYWYYNFGANVNHMQVIVKSNGVETIVADYIGQQQTTQTEAWRRGSHFLSGYAGNYVQVIFRGFNAPCCTGDLAVDDVAMTPLLETDATVSGIVSPQFPICPGSTSPIVDVKNNGFDTLTSVDVIMDVNGVLDTVAYNSQILPGETVPVTLNSVTINSSTVYNITFYTDNPNGIADMNPSDDTLALANLQTGIATGTYTINSANATGGTNFTSFSDFASAVNTFGLCGALTVDVVSGSGPYLEQLILDNVPGSSSSNTITINGHGETIQSSSTNSNERATIIIDNTSYVTIDSLNVNAVAGIYHWGVQFTGSTSYSSYTNGEVNCDQNSTSTFNIPVVMNNDRASYTSGFTGRNITIDNCELIGGYFNLTAYGSSSNNPSNIRITNNIQRDFYVYGNYIYYNDSVTVEGNDISRANRATISTFYGINLTICTNARINKNAIHNIADANQAYTGTVYPIYINADASTGNENYVTNNLIYNINHNGRVWAIYDLGSNSTSFLNNTISLDDTSSSSTTDARGFYQSASSTSSAFENNIITLSRGGSGAKHGIYLNNTSTSISVDYNNVYVNSSSSNYGYFGADASDLSAWQTLTTSYGANSFEIDPLYNNLSLDSLVPGSAQLNGAANSSPAVTEDFYGVARTSNPDIGAIEFDPPTLPNVSVKALVAPFKSQDSCYSASEDVIVNIFNAGGVDLDFTVDTTTITVDITGAINQTISLVLDDNSLNGGLPLAIGNDIDITIGSISMVSPGTYTFGIASSMAADYFAGDDSINVSFNIDPVTGGMIAGLDSICSGDSSILTATGYQGTLQWQQLIGSTWTDITGAISTKYTANVAVNTDYRVIACGTVPSDTITIVPVSVSAPMVVQNNAATGVCGQPGADTLIVAGAMGTESVWYSSANGNNVLANSDTLIYSVDSLIAPGSTDTFYVASRTAGGGAGGNIAPDATITGDGSGGGGCRPVGAVPAGCGSLNDLNLGTCGSQSMWISTNTPPSTTPGDDYIEWTFPTVRTFDTLVIHHAQTTSRFLTGALVQYWDGSAWVNHTTFSNLPQVCVNRVPIGKLSTDRFRITSWQAGTGQASNMNFREIEIIEVAGCESPRIAVVGQINCLTIGIDQTLGETASLSIYPNPSEGLFTLSINTPQLENFNLTVRDVQGKEVYTKNVNVNGEYRDNLDFTGFAKGIYYLQIQTDTETKVEKLIVQ